MSKYKFKVHSILVADSYNELTPFKLANFQKYEMMLSDVGENISDFDHHFAKLHEFCQNDLKEEHTAELENFRSQLANIYAGHRISFEAFKYLILEIDGENFRSQSQFSKLHDKLILIGVTEAKISEILEKTKKKFKNK